MFQNLHAPAILRPHIMEPLFIVMPGRKGGHGQASCVSCLAMGTGVGLGSFVGL